MTQNDLEWLFHDQLRFRASTTLRGSNFKDNCVKSNKYRHILPAAKMTLVSGNIAYIICRYSNQTKPNGVYRKTVAKQKWGGWNRQICSFACYIFVHFRNKVDIVVYYDNTPFWISAHTNKDDLECPIKVRFADGTPGVRLLWLMEFTTATCDWMNMGLNCQRQRCGQWIVVSGHNYEVCT